MQTRRTEHQYADRLRRDGTPHGETPLLEYQYPRDEHATGQLACDLGVLLLTSTFSLTLFWIIRSPLPVLIVLTTLALLFAASLQFRPECALLIGPYVAALLCFDVRVLVYLLPMASLLVGVFVIPRHYIWAYTTVPVSLDDLIVARKPYASSRGLLLKGFAVLLLLTLVLLPLSGDDRLFAIAAAYRSLRMLSGVVAVIYCLISPRKLRALYDATEHWFTNNARLNRDQPGIFRSPAGTASVRILIMNLLVMLLAGPEAYPAMMAYQPPILSGLLSQLPISAIPMPALTVLLALLFLASSRFVQVKKTYRAAAPNEWNSISERQALYRA